MLTMKSATAAALATVAVSGCGGSQDAQSTAPPKIYGGTALQTPLRAADQRPAVRALARRWWMASRSLSMCHPPKHALRFVLTASAGDLHRQLEAAPPRPSLANCGSVRPRAPYVAAFARDGRWIAVTAAADGGEATEQLTITPTNHGPPRDRDRLLARQPGEHDHVFYDHHARRRRRQGADHHHVARGTPSGAHRAPHPLRPVGRGPPRSSPRRSPPSS